MAQDDPRSRDRDSDADERWREQRREAAAAQAARAARALEVETAKARELVAGFVSQAQARGLATQPLRVRAGDGHTTYRTPLTGWYLRRDGSIGVGEDGQYYVLVTPVSLCLKLIGAHPEPSDPPLQVGRGGRDGESVALDTLLAMRLDAGDDWPIHR